MDQRNCVQCDAALTGRQMKYCSPKCASRASSMKALETGKRREYRQRPEVKERHRLRLREANYTQTFDCEWCGNSHTNRRGEQARFCGRVCAAADSCERHPRRKPKPPKAPPLDQRSPLRRAWEAQDWPTVTAVLLARTTRHPDGCMLWQGQISKDGYGRAKIAQRSIPAHRAMAVAMNAGPLGPDPVHHTCSNPTCINPEHLQIVRPHENNAEMLHRQWYLARIAALEDALSELNPDHILLTTLPIHLAATA